MNLQTLKTADPQAKRIMQWLDEGQHQNKNVFLKRSNGELPHFAMQHLRI